MLQGLFIIRTKAADSHVVCFFQTEHKEIDTTVSAGHLYDRRTQRCKSDSTNNDSDAGNVSPEPLAVR